MAASGSDNEPLLERKCISDEPPEIRAGFITKVYGILSAQLLLTAAIAAPFVLHPGLKAWMNQYGFPMVIFATVLNIGFLFAMMCPCGCERNMRKFPTNYILLFGFTASEGLLVGACCSHYTVGSVAVAVAATGVLVGALTAYAFWSKTDFTGMGPYLLAATMVLMFFGLFLMFLPSPFMHKVYCCLGILVFSFYLIFDTQMIVGKGQCSLGVDDYVYGALQLYIDIIQLFLYILQLFGDRE
mmetsp:Transcript_73422/g.215310  ORF Transcript_73422/g.215310 Transcript_73422/m.215310 type:complete len:242 (-) Transcript_73422:104-829(-)